MIPVIDKVIQLIIEYGVVGLFIISFLDSFILPTPPEILLIPLGLANPQLVFWYAAVTIVASVLGAMVGYVLGLYGGRPVVYRLFGKERVKKMEKLMEKHGAFAVVIAAFSPIPYKIVTITSGVLKASFKKMIFWSLIGRGARFFLEAAIIVAMGRAAGEFLTGKQFLLLTGGIGVAVLILYMVYLNRKRVK